MGVATSPMGGRSGKYMCVYSPVQVWHNLWLSEMENGWIPEQVQDSILPLQFI